MSIEHEIVRVLLENGNRMTAKEIVRAINEKRKSGEYGFCTDSGYALTKHDVNPWLYSMEIFEKDNSFAPVWSICPALLKAAQTAKRVTAHKEEAPAPVHCVHREKPMNIEMHCDNCQLRKSGKCSQLRNQVCDDFLAIPFISPEAKENFPAYGDATAIRLGEKR